MKNSNLNESDKEYLFESYQNNDPLFNLSKEEFDKLLDDESIEEYDVGDENNQLSEEEVQKIMGEI